MLLVVIGAVMLVVRGLILLILFEASLLGVVVVGDWPIPGFAGVALGELTRAGPMIPANALLTGVAVVTYAELRRRDDGCTTSALAAQLRARG